MARRPQTIEQPAEQGKFRVFYAEGVGTLQDLANVLSTVVRQQPTIQGRVSQIPQQLLPAARSNEVEGTAVEPDLVPESEDAPSVELSSSAPESNGQKRRRGDGQKVDRNAGIELVPNLDFVPTGKTPLKTFFVEKSPASDMEQVLVIAHYFQHTMVSPAFGPGHILTAFKHVGKPIPVDLKGTIRNMRRGKVWLNFTDIEHIRVTTEGDNHVEHELPKNGAK